VFTSRRCHIFSYNRRGRLSHISKFVTGERDQEIFPTNQAEHIVEIHGGAADSGYGRTNIQERIIRAGLFGMAGSDVNLDAIDARRVGISKTVEFDVEVSEWRIEGCSPSA
jgi:hypothetical protein